MKGRRLEYTRLAGWLGDGSGAPLPGLRLDRTDDDLPLHHLRVLEAHQICTTNTVLPQIVAVLSAVVDQIVLSRKPVSPPAQPGLRQRAQCVRWLPRPDRSLSS